MLTPVLRYLVLRYLRSDPVHAVGVGSLRRRNGETWESFAGRITFVVRNRAGRVIHMAARAVSSKARVKLGTSIKVEDARELARAAQVVYVPDNDEAGEAPAAWWREAVGHGAVIRLPNGVGEVNDLAQQADGAVGSLEKHTG